MCAMFMECKFSQLQLVVRDIVNISTISYMHILNNKLLVCTNWTVLFSVTTFQSLNCMLTYWSSIFLPSDLPGEAPQYEES